MNNEIKKLKNERERLLEKVCKELINFEKGKTKIRLK